SAGSGFTTRSTASGNLIEDRTVTATGSYAATARQNGTRWVMQMTAFRAAGAASTTTTQPPTTTTTTTSTTSTTRPPTTTPTAAPPTPTPTRAPPQASPDRPAAPPPPPPPPPPTADTTAPTVAITAPAQNANVTDIISVTASASDNVGVVGVQFYVDGVPVGVEDGTPPYAYTWDTRSFANGGHSLAARARDAAGNATTSSSVTDTGPKVSGFQNEILATGLNLPTSMKFLPDGRMLVSELTGAIKVLPSPYLSPDASPFLLLTNVGNTGYAGLQQGIFDFALDPNFATNHYYYV